MIKRDHNGLPPELREAARRLRDTPEPNEAWRQRLRREIDAAPPPKPRVDATPRAPRRWAMRPFTAIAAGLACMLIGGATVAAVMTSRAPTTAQSPQPTAQSRIAHSRIRFTLVAPSASRVSIVGDFNGWNPTALPMRRSGDGRTWEVEVPLAPGRYAYSFVVDGALARDPAAPQARDEDLGTTNSVVMVRGS